jgi:membrane protease YdiL (CAAX protease family)
MRKILPVLFEYLGLSFIIAVLGILMHCFLDLENLLLNLAYWTLRGLGIAVIVYAVRRFKDGWSLKDLGFRIHRTRGKDIWFGFIGFCLLYFLEFPILLVNLPYQADLLAESMNLFPGIPFPVLLVLGFVLALVFGFITGAWHEEIWHRGYIQGVFSRKIAPVVGFLISSIPFGITHHFSHPEYNLLLIVGCVFGGAVYCLVFYASGSLLAAMTAHALSNAIPIFMPLFYAYGYRSTSYLVAVGIGFVLVGFCFKGRKEIMELIEKAKGLFLESGTKHILIGIALATLSVLISWIRSVFVEQFGTNIQVITYSVLGFIILAFSFIKNE